MQTSYRTMLLRYQIELINSKKNTVNNPESCRKFRSLLD